MTKRVVWWISYREVPGENNYFPRLRGTEMKADEDGF